jgi:plasmid stabilization system protein ParE
MSHRLYLSREARECIEEQMRGYEAAAEHGGAELADRWLERLEIALAKLSQHPTRHGFAPENGRWQPQLELRQMRLQSWKTGSVWRILFVIDEGAQAVTVIQIRHARRRFLHEED